MKKYLTIIKAYWQRSFTYRFTITSYRIGETVEILVLILMWSAIYKNQPMIGGLNFNQMVTYILLGNFFQIMTRNFLSDLIARDIKERKLSMYLIRPISYFRYILTQEFGRIFLVTLLSLFFQSIVIIFFAGSLYWNFELKYILVIMAIIILGAITEMLLGFLIGLVAFWTDEVDGLYRTVDRIKRFFSGGFFPLNLLPLRFVQASFLMPFAYTFFIPSQIYLKRLDLSVGLKGLLVQSVWILILYWLITIFWSRGLKKYEGVGI